MLGKQILCYSLRKHAWQCNRILANSCLEPRCLTLFSLFQNERAYQKQPTIFQNKKRVLVADGKEGGKEKLPRYHRNVGLGFKTPREVSWILWVRGILMRYDMMPNTYKLVVGSSCIWLFLTMVFQAPRALTTMPKGYADAVLYV